jgi:anti-sigma factor RsiW
MKPCREYQQLLLDRAAGALPPETEPRLAGHLETCLACRAESRALGEALSLAALPPVSEAEARTLEGLGGETLRAWRTGRPAHMPWRGLGAGIAVVAAAAAVVLVLPVMRHGKAVPAPSGPAAVQATWQEPDLDAVWETSGALVNGASEYGAAEEDASDETPIFADLDFDSL